MNKKLFPLALVALLAACTYDHNGNMTWAGGDYWSHCDRCVWGSERTLYERNLGAVRGAHHEEFEHNDVVADGFYYNAPWSYYANNGYAATTYTNNGAVVTQTTTYDHPHHHHHHHHNKQADNQPNSVPATTKSTR